MHTMPSIPPALAVLPNLKSLVIERMHFLDGAEEQLVPLKGLGHCLQNLVMKDCQLQVVPEWFGPSLTGLTSLMLTGNRIQQLPESFGKLQQLQVIGEG
jgi:Leucine-rich repeat (LRR) protein